MEAFGAMLASDEPRSGKGNDNTVDMSDCWDYTPGGDFLTVQAPEKPRYSTEELSEGFAEKWEDMWKVAARWTPDFGLLEGQPPEGIKEMLDSMADRRDQVTSDVIAYVSSYLDSPPDNAAENNGSAAASTSKELSSVENGGRRGRGRGPDGEDGRGLFSRNLARWPSRICGDRCVAAFPCLPPLDVDTPSQSSQASSKRSSGPAKPSSFDDFLDEPEIPVVSQAKLDSLTALFPDVERILLAGCLSECDEDLEAAKERIAGLKTWRHKALPISEASIAEVLAMRKLFIMGKDRKGHPILLFMGTRHEKGDIDANMRLFVYYMEQAIRSMDEGVHKVLLLLCLAEGTPLDLDFVSGIRTTTQMHYPGRIWRVLVFPTGVMTGWLWTISSVLLDTHSRKSVKLMPPDGGLKSPTLLEYIEPDQLLVEFGGTLPLAEMEARCYGGASKGAGS
mmetsp:Transcript_6124/g.13608  ORF Transcript_6124/g.13608 Transcript_6124/m.13608 type:complete len:450 (-) Transcript_6124:174-1523(-)